jgi:hypothetical protein
MLRADSNRAFAARDLKKEPFETGFVLHVRNHETPATLNVAEMFLKLF